MNPTPSPRGRFRRGWPGFFVLISLVSVMISTTACDEFGARRKIQEGNRLYENGRFSQAAKEFEDALKTAPELEIAHYNAGLAYYRLFQAAQADPDAKDEEVEALADKSTEHFAVYLEKQPDDGQIIGLMTRIWLDSGQYKDALAFWEARQAKDPKNAEVLGILASINRQSGNKLKAIEWHKIQADALETDAGKAKVYLDVARIIWHELAKRETVVGKQRLKYADIGLGILQKALTLNVDEQTQVEIQGYLASFFDFRALAHAGSWARVTERASSQYHRAVWRKLREKIKEQEDKEAHDAENKAGGASGHPAKPLQAPAGGQ